MPGAADDASYIDDVLAQILESADDADRALDAGDLTELRRVIGDIRMEAAELRGRTGRLGERLVRLESRIEAILAR